MEDGIEDALKNDDVFMAGSSGYTALLPDVFFFVVHIFVILLSHPVVKYIQVKKRKIIGKNSKGGLQYF